MPRRPRIKLAGLPQHIVQRGINREPCFFAEEDCHSYLHWLEKAAADWHCAIHAYVLMTNHVHLLVTPETETGTAKLMQAIGRRYVQYINRSYKRTGSLWEGRYKSSLVQEDAYLLTCMRYIELNPVRADMVQDPGQYRWSSYRHNGLGQADRRITPHPLYLALDQDGPGRHIAYRALFRSQLDDEALADIRLALSQGRPLGSDRFSDKVCAAVGIRRMQSKPGRPTGKPVRSDESKDQVDFGF
ncbi:putative transposase [Sulfuritortus calidifontis]|uniref:Putative transposase n=1 Tax=Sulfuritortus calidifontis TaxID=1914471 RepID=A0A4R3JWP7_9PROT|nr:transposase [Sulfuritortus calidifontis]TCS72639.1 putative transposase [Sulfuritortus calidifontis]